MAHAARFDLLVSQVQQKLRDKPWRTDLPAARPACGPHTAAVLEGVEAALRTPAVVRAARLLYQEYISVRIACTSLLRMFNRVMDAL